MMKLADYLDSTYLKTPKQSGLSDSQTLEKVHQLTREAIANDFYAVMIRPDYVRSVKMMIDEFKSSVKLGTVIDFPEGRNSVSEKLAEAQRAIADGADELDFVIDYNAFKSGNLEKIKEEIESCTRLGLNFDKTVKWIIETAALSDDEIAGYAIMAPTIRRPKAVTVYFVARFDRPFHAFAGWKEGQLISGNDVIEGAATGVKPREGGSRGRGVLTCTDRCCRWLV